MNSDLIGEVRPFACAALPEGWRACDGGLLPIAEHQPLFSLLGWRYGGDGRTTFGVPALRLHAAASGEKLTYGIAVNGLYPTRDDTMLEAPKVGEIRLFAGQNAPAGWMPCDGRTLPVAPPFLELYRIIGSTFGGDADRFALPNLWAEEQRAEGAGSVGRLSYIVVVAAAETPPEFPTP